MCNAADLFVLGAKWLARNTGEATLARMLFSVVAVEPGLFKFTEEARGVERCDEDFSCE